MTSAQTDAREDLFLSDEFVNLIVGDFIGQGATRYVYELKNQKALDGYVIKIESTEDRSLFQNQIEWSVWDQIGSYGVGQWLAPCLAISKTGRYLIQRRTTPIYANQLPAKVPAFLSDLQANNWGLMDGRVVCHDYGYSVLFGTGTHLKKAKFSLP